MEGPQDSSPDDRLAASVFAAGLNLGFVRREDVVRWADRRIDELPTPPGWLIDLSLSRNLDLTDLVSMLRRVGAGADPVETCKAVYALFPDVRDLSFDRAAERAGLLYRITAECLAWDWDCPLLAEADHVDDMFGFVRDGYVDLGREGAVAQFQEFLDRHRGPGSAGLLHPVAWSERT